MFLPSLLGHASQLFRLVWTSTNPADALASEYFRSKKYIGGRERRFISETVFACMRGYSALHFAAQKGFAALPEPYSLLPKSKPDKKRKDEQSVLFNELGIVSAACLLGSVLGIFSAETALAEIPRERKNPEESPLDAESEQSEFSELQEFIAQSFARAGDIPAEIGRAWTREVLSVAADIEQLEMKKNWDKTADDEHESPSIPTLASIQPWIFETWSKRRSPEFALSLALSLLPSALPVLRVNTRLATPERVRGLLIAQEIPCSHGKLAPSALILHKRKDLTQSEMYKSGVIEVQDEASQLLAYALAPEQDWLVLDACAGAGGKSLHIATLMNDKGQIIAADIEYNRLREISHRARRAGLRSIRPFHLVSRTPLGIFPNELIGIKADCDAVVVDAPCSGMGTTRRMPMAKWRLNPDIVQKHQRKQLAVLETYAQGVMGGGVLIYATCSIMPQENEDVIEQFLARNPEFYPEPLAPIFAKNGIEIPHLSADSATLTLTPAEHGTDGFFLARMRKSL